MKFEYKKSIVSPAPGFESGTLFQPKIPIVLVGPTGELRFEALVDTGSDQTIFPLIDVEHITGIIINRQHTAEVRGRLEDHREELFLGTHCKLRLSNNNTTSEFSSSIWFSEDANSPAILGHRGFLEFFNVLFQGAKKELKIIPNENFIGTTKKLTW